MPPLGSSLLPEREQDNCEEQSTKGNFWYPVLFQGNGLIKEDSPWPRFPWHLQPPQEYSPTSAANIESRPVWEVMAYVRLVSALPSTVLATHVAEQMSDFG